MPVSPLIRRLALASAMAALSPIQAAAGGAIETYTAVPASPRFAINAFEVSGNTLLPADEIQRLLAPYKGDSRDFGDVQSALQALQSGYQDLGYSAVRVLLPEQALEKGVVRIEVIQQKIVSVNVSGNQHFDDANILASVPALKIGEPPNAREVARNIRVGNENPAKFATVHFKSSEQDLDGIDATIRVLDEKSQHVFFTLDNTGNSQTKDIRMGIGYQNYNMFNRDHRFTAQFITSPQSDLGFSDLRIFAFGYSIPLYEQGNSVDFLAAYSDVDAGTLLGGALDITSKGTVLGAHYNWNLDRVGNYQHKLNLGLDYRNYDPDTSFGSVNLTPEVTATPFSATYSGLWKTAERQFGFNAGIVANIADLASHGGADDFAAPPWLAEDDFRRYTWGMDYTQTLVSDWQVHLAASGQFASDHLHPGEQFGLGGMDSTRGWHERAFSGDRGYRASIELVSPNFGRALAEKLSLKTLAFYDVGHVSNQDNVLGDKVGNRITLGSVGAGLRMGYGKHLLARADLAVVVDGDQTNSASATYQQSRDDGDTYLHVSLGWVW
jgi:hemolysin activation/secretion protein